MRTRLIPPLLVLALLAAACGGNGDEPLPTGPVPPAPEGPVPEATPFAQVPEPTIVTGDDTGASAPANGGEADVIYIVEAGDALLLIAERYGVTVEAIQAANNLDGFDIFVGQELIIPRSAAAPTAPTAAATPPPAPDLPTAPDGVYVVQPGDTPLGIAFQFDVTLEALEAANGGPGSLDNLQIGRELIIP